MPPGQEKKLIRSFFDKIFSGNVHKTHNQRMRSRFVFIKNHVDLFYRHFDPKAFTNTQYRTLFLRAFVIFALITRYRISTNP